VYVPRANISSIILLLNLHGCMNLRRASLCDDFLQTGFKTGMEKKLASTCCILLSLYMY